MLPSGPVKERGGWDVVKEDRKRASAHTDRKSDAVNRAREIVRNEGGGEIRIANQRVASLTPTR